MQKQTFYGLHVHSNCEKKKFNLIHKVNACVVIKGWYGGPPKAPEATVSEF